MFGLRGELAENGSSIAWSNKAQWMAMSRVPSPEAEMYKGAPTVDLGGSWLDTHGMGTLLQLSHGVNRETVIAENPAMWWSPASGTINDQQQLFMSFTPDLKYASTSCMMPRYDADQQG